MNKKLIETSLTTVDLSETNHLLSQLAREYIIETYESFANKYEIDVDDFIDLLYFMYLKGKLENNTGLLVKLNSMNNILQDQLKEGLNSD